jgi:hypothetical protein
MHLSATVIISAVKYLGKTHPSSADVVISVHPARLSWPVDLVESWTAKVNPAVQIF